MGDYANYLDPNKSTCVEPYSDHSVEAIGPSCLDVNTTNGWAAKNREGGVWLGTWMTIAFGAISCIPGVHYWMKTGDFGEALLFPLMGVAFVPVTLRFIYSWRNDRPVRFNRLRREVYFQRRGEVYVLDWDTIRAYTATAAVISAGGGRAREAHLNIVYTTDERGRTGAFSLTAPMRAGVPFEKQALALWEYIRLYMEEGPEVLPSPTPSAPQYESLEEVRAALNPFPLRASRWWSWPLEVGLFFPGRVLFFLITYPTDWIYLRLAERLEVKPYADEILERCADSETEEARQKRIAALKQRYRSRIREIPREIEQERKSLLGSYDANFIRFLGAVPFGEDKNKYLTDGVPTEWFRTPLTELVEFNPRGKPPSEKETCFVPLEAIRKQGIVLNRRKLKHTCPDEAPAVLRNGDVIFPAGTAWLDEDRVAVVTVLDDPMPDERVALAKVLGSYERACAPAGLLVMRGKNIGPAFVSCLARDPRLKEHVRQKMENQPSGAPLPAGSFDDFSLPKPPSHELKRIERNVLNPMLQKIVELEREGVRLRTRYRLLLECEARPAV